MLYLIGGASRAGKTLVAQQLLEEHSIPRFSVDYLITALYQGAPELGINHDQSRAKRSENVWPFLKPLLLNLLHEEPSFTFEGDALRPALIKKLIEENPGLVRACFLGYPDADGQSKASAIASFAGRINNWTSGMSAAELQQCVEEEVRSSREIRAECTAANLRFVDMSLDFDAGRRVAVEFLLNGEGAP